MDRSPACLTLCYLSPARDPAITTSKPCHWTCVVAWVNEHQADEAEGRAA